MYRLLIVDDEDIITDGLYEVFNRLMPERLDVCKAYSGKEALQWMSRTRIDIVLTDIGMPGINGMEMAEQIRAFWPRCKVIFLTGHEEFNYVYKAIQMQEMRYLLKTEGYDKVTQTVREVIQELDHSNRMSKLLEQSREQIHSLELKAQGDYIRHLLQESEVHCEDEEALVKCFNKLNVGLDPGHPVVLVLGHLSFPAGTTYIERNEILASVNMIWKSYLSEQTQSIGIEDKHGDMLWLLQPSQDVGEKFDSHLIRYLEGTLELVQESCMGSLNLTIGFTIGGTSCEWRTITRQYEKLRQLQQLKIGDGISILSDSTETFDPSSVAGGFVLSQKSEVMAAHLEAGRAAEFFEELEALSKLAVTIGTNVENTVEAYYSAALVLLSYINRMGLHGQIGSYGRLMRLEEHATVIEGFQYLQQIAESLFTYKRLDERDRVAHTIGRICRYIEDHLGEDLSLVRLAEIHYFNPCYLSRLFKQERGINLSEYIDKCRVRKAKELLRDGDLKVREVASLVGYDAAHSFTRFFKKVTGLSPQEYRDAHPLC